MNNIRKLMGPAIKSSEETKYIVFFLHGWGSNGDDLIEIGKHWSSYFPSVTFLSPNGPEECDMNPSGRQWFSIDHQNPKNMNIGLEKAYLDLENYISNKIKDYNILPSNFAVVGFSQGTMLALHLSIRLKCLGIIGYSGAYIENKLPVTIIKNDILLLHGKKDEVVPISRMYEAYNFLKPLSCSIKNVVSENLAHSIDIEGLDKGKDFLSINLK